VKKIAIQNRPKLIMSASELLIRQKGVAAILIVAMLFVFIVTAALTVDVAYMQLVRTELRASTDAAAKAAAEALARTESRSDAITAAKQYAQRNSVGGQPFLIRNRDVKFGRVELAASGRWEFVEGANPSNAVRVDGNISDTSRTKSLPLFFANALGHNNFSTSSSATAAQLDVEVCLALDRSGSMLFDMSGVDYEYPPNNPRLSSFTAWGSLWRNHLSPPHPTNSRWAVLANAVNLFLDEAGQYEQPPRAALVTWGNDYTMPIAPSTFYPAVETNVNLPNRESDNWNQNATSISQSVAQKNTIPMMGGTNMSAGIDRSVEILTGSNSSGLANKVIILLTDGVWNAGRDPEAAARDARDQGIVIHTVSMLSQDTATLVNIADITGGKFYSARNSTELRAAFYELARTLPVVLTD
jgi:Ca-activated chloride channel homolog